MAATTTTDQFLDLLRKSELIDEARLDAFLTGTGVPASDKPKALAEMLIRQGLLTPFHAGHLLAGKWRGFKIAGGKYKLLQLLGIGGMGKVYLCEHLRMKRLVAIKVLPHEHSKEDVASVERFNREAQASAALNHANIVRAFDVDQDGAMHYIVMEYVDGSSLQDIVRKHGPLEIHRACHYISQAAVGLQHAHEAGWVHRDIKPGNLLLDRSGTVKILDMGLARLFVTPEADQLTKKFDNNSVLGTADYLAPEQAVNSSDVDIRADIYSLGATFYFLLTGHSPFEQGTITEKLLAHQMKDPASITSLRPDIPKPLETIIKKMMAKKPVHRYQTPHGVVEALQPWTQVPIELPADEEMPRLCTALESYVVPGSNAPMSSISGPGSARLRPSSNGQMSSGALLRKKQRRKRLLANMSERARLVLGASIGAVVMMAALFVGWYVFSGPKSSTNKGSSGVVKKPVEQPPQVVDKPKPVTPSAAAGVVTPIEAAKRVGDKLTIEFETKSTGGTRDQSRVFLNSAGMSDPNNFTIVLEMKKVGEDLKKAGISDPREFYKGKTVRVTGTVSLYNGKPQIVVDSFGQIELVKK